MVWLKQLLHKNIEYRPIPTPIIPAAPNIMPAIHNHFSSTIIDMPPIVMPMASSVTEIEKMRWVVFARLTLVFIQGSLLHELLYLCFEGLDLIHLIFIGCFSKTDQ